MIVNWSNYVNTKFFAFKKSPKDNAVITQMDSGRKVGFLKNTKALFSIECSLRLDKKNNEDAAFWSWYNNSLGGTAGFFNCPALGNATYTFSSIPEPQDTSLRYVTLGLKIDEV